MQSHLLESLIGFDHQGWSVVLYRSLTGYYVIYYAGNTMDRVISIIPNPQSSRIEFKDAEDIYYQHQDRLKDVVEESIAEKACKLARGESSWTSGVTEH